MASISLPRSQRPSAKPSSTSASTSRSLARNQSSLSFQSDADKPYTLNKDGYSASSTYQSNNIDARHAPLSFKSNGRIGEPRGPRKHQAKSSVKSTTSLKEDPRPKERKGKERELEFPDGAYGFTHDITSYGNGEATPKSRTRLRPSTSPSKYEWREHSDIPSPRDSGSSSLTHFETPPHTPIDELLSLRDSLERISVVAPISDVEAMDAMVDGMNGFGADDRFFGRSFLSGRSSKAEKAGFHPLYHPPLPTPPPGVTLGGGIARKASEPSIKESDEDDEELKPQPFHRSQERRKGRRQQSSSHSTSNITVTRISHQRPADIQFPRVNPSIDEIIQNHMPESMGKQKIPSIAEIIRSHGPKQTSQTSKSSQKFSFGDDEPVMESLTVEAEAEFLSRSSVDSVAEEVLNTITWHSISPPAAGTLQRARSFAHHQSVYSESVADGSIRSPRSDVTSMHSFSIISSEPTQPPFLDFLTSASPRPPSASQAIAQYLRSARLTTLLKLTRAPHASRGHPLTVSLSDLGSPTGFPLVVFLGLGCVRHVMGLYDEMAECLGLRLITIDRWGLGRTQTPQSKLARGIPEWSSVVAEVLDCLGIDKCSVMAHSAGAPYALAFANQYPDRIRGDICLLAPWIGEGAGYKWLKYVPNGILKTAQAADWKIQAWMLGKPPTINYEGIGYDMKAPLSSSIVGHDSLSPHTPSRSFSTRKNQDENMPRPSTDSGIFSDYDDLRDFDGRFESRSTVGKSIESSRPRHFSESKNLTHWGGGKKSSRGILGKLRGSNSQPPSPALDKPSPVGSGRRLKALRSMSSLKNKASSAPSTISRIASSPMPKLPQPLSIEVGLGLDEIKWGSSRTPSPVKKSHMTNGSPEPPPSSFPRSDGNRSTSFGTYRSPQSSFPPSPLSSSAPPSPAEVAGGSYQAMLGNALIAASHSESAKGTHGDLLQILNHDRVPWGFSYSDYPHSVRVWYGDRDERIGESAVRWMESTMGTSRCHVNVVKGADHGLMYKSSVVIEVFEQVHDYLRED